MNDKIRASWEKFLNPATLRKNLTSAAVFLAAYEMMNDSLVEHLRGFFSNTWTAENGWEIGPEYKTQVQSLDRHEVVACAKWFKNSGALDEADLTILKEIADHRNVVAHELPMLLGNAEREISISHLHAMHRITTKVDRWWIKYVEVDTDPAFDERKPTEQELDQSFSMTMAMMQLLISVAEGDDSSLMSLYEGWQKRTAPTASRQTAPR